MYSIMFVESLTAELNFFKAAYVGNLVLCALGLRCQPSIVCTWVKNVKNVKMLWEEGSGSGILLFRTQNDGDHEIWIFRH